MEMPPVTAESEVLLDIYGVYHIAQLGADPKTKHLLAGFEDVQNKLRARMTARKDLGRAMTTTESIEDRADLELDQAIKNFERDILKEVEDNRKDPLFIKYFSEGLRYVTAAPLPEEVSRVEKILANLREESAGSLKQEHLSLIESKLGELKKAINLVRGAVDSHAEAFSLEISTRLEWRRIYKKDEADIAGIYVGNKKKVDSFFKKVAKKKGAAAGVAAASNGSADAGSENGGKVSG